MKRVGLVTSLISTITLIIVLCLLLVMSLVYNNKYKVMDSLVFIESIGDASTKEGMGFVYKVDNDYNYIITNYHVVSDADYLYVYNSDNDKEQAVIGDYDVYTDIAILRIDDDLDLEEVKIASNDMKINDSVYFYNIDDKVIDMGTIIGLDNEINLNTDYGNSFYNANSIKANISNGNSGGALFNDDDEAIGLISLKEEKNDVGFYIPIDNVVNIVTKLENNTLIRPNLGAIFANATNIELLNKYGINSIDINGVVVLEVTNDYPLYVAGLNKGDIITKIDNIVIENVVELQKQIYSHNIDDIINLEYYRNNNLNKVDVVLTK